MVRVNGVKFKVYELDTDESIISRICENLGTIEKYLYFPDGRDNLRNRKNIEVFDILQYIRDKSRKSTDYKKFLEKFKSSFPQVEKMLDLKSDVLEVWLAYNQRLSEFEGMGGSLMTDSIGEDLVKGNFFTNSNEFRNFWKNIKPVKIRDLERSIEKNRESVNKYIELYKTFEEIEEGLVYTPLKKEKVVFDMILNLHDITLTEIFNQILLTDTIPFAYCKNYYKILKDYVPSEEWVMKGREEDNSIILKMYEKSNLNLQNYKDYTDVVVTVADNVSVSMQLITERGYLELEDFIKRFTSVFYGLGDVNSEEIIEKKIFGIFYFPKEYLDSYVFADLVMNDRNFSNLINIDESKKATKKKGIGTQPLTYIHFNHPNTGHITASIIQKFVDRSDPEMRDQDRDIFSQNDPYIRVRVKGVNTKSIESFIQMFSKLLVIYNQKYNQIVELYKRFIPEFGKVETVLKPDKETDNKVIAPDVFVSNYSRKCANIPEIIPKEDVDKYDYQKVMLFPRDVQDNAPHYPSDGKNQQYYVCRNPEFPYPGVQVNKLKNKDHYPFTPCCFRDQQKDKKGRTYNTYFLNEEKDLKDKKQQDFIITNKFVKQNQFGLLPQDLSNFLKLLNPSDDTTYKYVRLGVSDNSEEGKYSFLKTVMYGLYEQTGILEYEGKEVEQKILDTLTELTFPDVCVMARQSMYDSTIADIIRNINPDTYFDPKYYLQLLEGFFNCNIYLFRNNGVETRPTLPRYTEGYYKYSRKNSPCVFVYEHLGSESDNAKHPQCELIIKWKEENRTDTQYYYNSSSRIINNLDKFLNILNLTYSLDRKLSQIELHINTDSVKLLSQTLDSYGKTRRIDLVYGNTTASLLTSPIPPLNIRESEENSAVQKVSIDIALKIFSSLGVELTSQTISVLSLKEINGVLGNVNVTIPVLDTDPLRDLKISKLGLHFPESKFSVLETYNNNKKIVRYITEYMLWLFSQYISDNNIQNITNRDILNFSKNKLVIVPDHKYEIVPKIFSVNSKLMKSGKLIVSSEEMLKRLLYVLRLYITRNYTALINYRNQKVISHYYVDITDFTNFPKQVIMQGDDSVDKWIQQSKFKYIMYNSIIHSKNTPYFFSNPKINNSTVFLAQNTKTIEDAISVSIGWQKNKYNNTIIITQLSEEYTCSIYFYVDPNNIFPYIIQGKTIPKSEVNIIVSKLGDRLFYTTLLSLSDLEP